MAVMAARFTASGAPRHAPELNGIWLREGGERPEAGAGRPSFVHSADSTLTLRHDGQNWNIEKARASSGSQLLAQAPGDAEHPHTVRPLDVWSIHEPPKFAGIVSSPGLRPCPEFEIVCDGVSSREEPFSLDDLGRDFFIRGDMKRGAIYWYRCPASGEVYHSAAKANLRSDPNRSEPGYRYCHLCHKSFSANNFTSQHMKNRHRPEEPTDLTVSVAAADDKPAATLKWEPPQRGEQRLKIVSYKIQMAATSSGGQPQLLGEPMSTSSSSTTFSLEVPVGGAYRFAVAAVNAAGMIGDFSNFSQPIRIPAAAATAAPAAVGTCTVSNVASISAVGVGNSVGVSPVVGVGGVSPVGVGVGGGLVSPTPSLPTEPLGSPYTPPSEYAATDADTTSVPQSPTPLFPAYEERQRLAGAIVAAATGAAAAIFRPSKRGRESADSWPERDSDRQLNRFQRHEDVGVGVGVCVGGVGVGDARGGRRSSEVSQISSRASLDPNAAAAAAAAAHGLSPFHATSICAAPAATTAASAAAAAARTSPPYDYPLEPLDTRAGYGYDDGDGDEMNDATPIVRMGEEVVFTVADFLEAAESELKHDDGRPGYPRSLSQFLSVSADEAPTGLPLDDPMGETADADALASASDAEAARTVAFAFSDTDADADPDAYGAGVGFGVGVGVGGGGGGGGGGGLAVGEYFGGPGTSPVRQRSRSLTSILAEDTVIPVWRSMRRASRPLIILAAKSFKVSSADGKPGTKTNKLALTLTLILTAVVAVVAVAAAALASVVSVTTLTTLATGGGWPWASAPAPAAVVCEWRWVPPAGCRASDGEHAACGIELKRSLPWKPKCTLREHKA